MPSLQPAGGHCATVRGCGRCTTWSLIGRELRATSLRAVGWPSTTRICSVTTLSWIGDPAVAPRMAFGDALVKALIGDGPLLTLPGWRPALLMLTSGFAGLLPATAGRADPPDFHHAPLSAASLENPYHGQASAAQAGRELYAVHCAACHGRSAEGTGNIPALARGALRRVSWAQRGRHRQYSGPGAWAGAERRGRRGFLVHHQRIQQRRDAVMGFATRTAALAARHLSEDAGGCTHRGPGTRCRSHDTNHCAASAGTVH